MSKTLRLTTLIKKGIAKAGNAHQLARLINDENAAAKTHITVNSKTLKKIADKPEQVRLTLRLLTALDVYYRKKGESLQEKPIFEQHGILECLVAKRKVTFLLGARPRARERRTDVSRWDARSLAELLGEACKFDVHMDYEIEDVLWKAPMDAKKVATEPWHALLRDDTRSLVAIGSPLACHASEAMLARMWGKNPFQTPVPTITEKDGVPFYFVFSPQKGRQLRSSFGVTWRELNSIDAGKAEAVRKNKASAFVLDSEVYPVPLDAERWEMYGIIAAQRRSGGNVWLVVSGLSGPATYAAASLVKKVTAELPWPRGNDLPILWLPVKAVISVDKSRKDSGDNREVESVEPIGNPRVSYPPKK